MTLPPSERPPVLGPLKLLLKSTRFLTAVVALLVGMLVTQIPSLAPYSDELLVLIGALAFVVIGGYSYDDASRMAHELGAQPLKPINEQLRDVSDAAIDAVIPPGGSAEVRINTSTESPRLYPPGSDTASS
jgi:hypothetical protein